MIDTRTFIHIYRLTYLAESDTVGSDVLELAVNLLELKEIGDHTLLLFLLYPRSGQSDSVACGKCRHAYLKVLGFEGVTGIVNDNEASAVDDVLVHGVFREEDGVHVTGLRGKGERVGKRTDKNRGGHS